MLLTKQRKRMLPKVMKKLVYIRYEKKYRKWMERLGVSVSEEELKNLSLLRRELKRMELTDMTLKCRMRTEW